MNDVTDTAFVVSVYYDGPEGAARINLKWKGVHEISDFDFDQLGDLIACGTETQNAGWVIVRFSRGLHVASLPPESQFAPVVLQSHNPVGVGDSIHLRPSSKERLQSPDEEIANFVSAGAG